MKYDVFMRTRTYDRDYDWVCKPGYMPVSVFDTCKSIISLCENAAFDSLGWEEWYSNFYYLRIEGCCILARVAKTKYNCPDKKSILSFEGVSVEEKYEKQLFYNIPGLINEMLPPAKSFRARFEEEGFMPDTVEIKSIIEPFATTLPEEVHPGVAHNAGFNNLLKFTAFTDKPAGYMFGKNAKDFSAHISKAGLGIFHVFDFAAPDEVNVDENSFTDNYDALVCEYTPRIATGQDRVAINLIVQETGEDSYKYKWEVKPWDTTSKDGKRVRYSTQFFEMDDRVELAKLELQKESIKQFLIDNGWKKQPVGLRFEKDTFNQDVAPSP